MGSIVSDDFRTARVFSKHGIDFCCQGRKTIDKACQEKSLDTQKLIQELEGVMEKKDGSETDYKTWAAPVLIDHILDTYHAYIREVTPAILQYGEKVARVHGDHHPELMDIHREMSISLQELEQHMKKEENVLFPYIIEMYNAKELEAELKPPFFGSVENPIHMMEHEHEAEGERFRKISLLSRDYTPPEDACNTYRVYYGMLNEFEEKLHLHIHLENNILFPSAQLLEKELQD